MKIQIKNSMGHSDKNYLGVVDCHEVATNPYSSQEFSSLTPLLTVEKN